MSSKKLDYLFSLFLIQSNVFPLALQCNDQIGLWCSPVNFIWYIWKISVKLSLAVTLSKKCPKLTIPSPPNNTKKKKIFSGIHAQILHVKEESRGNPQAAVLLFWQLWHCACPRIEWMHEDHPRVWQSDC